MPLEIIDLIPGYIRWQNGSEGLDSYIRTYSTFFDHYFTFWAKNRQITATLSEGDAISRADRLRHHLSQAERSFKEDGLTLEGVSAVLFVGQGKANGHAFIDGSKPIAWYAIETLETDDEMRIFVTHELIHALQYSIDPESYFQSAQQKNSVSRQLVTEGTATYLTMILSSASEEQALWADTLSPQALDKWMNACKDAEENLYRFAFENFESSDPAIGLFLAADPNDIYRFRAGYYAGLKIIEQIAHEGSLSPHDLLHTSMRSLVDRARATLRSFCDY